MQMNSEPDVWGLRHGFALPSVASRSPHCLGGDPTWPPSPLVTPGTSWAIQQARSFPGSRF